MAIQQTHYRKIQIDSIHFIYVCVCTVSVCAFVGSCLATKLQFAGYGKGVGHHKVGQR